jgi:hypothetical protein
MAVRADTLRQLEGRLLDYHLNLDIDQDPEVVRRVRGEFDVYAAVWPSRASRGAQWQSPEPALTSGMR